MENLEELNALSEDTRNWFRDLLQERRNLLAREDLDEVMRELLCEEIDRKLECLGDHVGMTAEHFELLERLQELQREREMLRARMDALTRAVLLIQTLDRDSKLTIVDTPALERAQGFSRRNREDSELGDDL